MRTLSDEEWHEKTLGLQEIHTENRSVSLLIPSLCLNAPKHFPQPNFNSYVMPFAKMRKGRVLSVQRITRPQWRREALLRIECIHVKYVWLLSALKQKLTTSPWLKHDRDFPEKKKGSWRTMAWTKDFTICFLPLHFAHPVVNGLRLS